MPITYAPQGETPSPLGKMHILSPTCSLRVSPLVLGNMSLGETWAEAGPALGKCTKQQAFEVYDTFYELGGNYIDTSCNYQDGESEIWLGEWLAKTGLRDQMVLATKFTTAFDANVKYRAQHAGNGVKSMHLAVEGSLKKLQTSYIDILFVHWWDWTTSIEEVMQGLNNLVRQGKVLHLGISDTPAWIVASCNMYARQHNLSPFVVYQGKYSLDERSAERDLLPMMRHFGMAFTPWGVMGGGRFQTPEEIKRRQAEKETLRGGNKPLTEKEIRVSKALYEVGQELGGKSLSAVALAYAMSKQPYIYPIVGGRKASYLRENVEALSIRFTEEQLQRLDSANGAFSLGEPMNVFGLDPHYNGGQPCYILKYAGDYEFVQGPRGFTAPTTKHITAAERAPLT